MKLYFSKRLLAFFCLLFILSPATFAQLSSPGETGAEVGRVAAYGSSDSVLFVYVDNLQSDYASTATQTSFASPDARDTKIRPVGELRISRNPGESFVTFSFDNPEHETFEIAIYGVDGTELYRHWIRSEEARLDIRRWYAGTYLIRVTGNGSSFSGKMIVT